MASAPYRGRFAPSPTGPLHFGSLVAAVGSYLEAKSRDGAWLVRIEDIDPPREMPGAADDILRTLEAYGFEWNGPVLYQSRRGDLYDAALEKLDNDRLLYPCACTRREIADSALPGIEGPIYPGTCRRGLLAGRTPRAVRVRVDAVEIEFEDAIQGTIRQNLARDIGDFVLKRADGFFAYQLAVVVDDAAQGITHVVRGSDLLDSTPRQMYLQQLLGWSTPNYAHLPVATNAAGEKLSKQTLAQPLDPKQPTPALWQALDFLGQNPPGELAAGALGDLWSWAMAQWDMRLVPRRKSCVSMRNL
ncbi:MAG TPA: tRNA glutamyl-Q(34) synthetase GluQRS [Methylophilaceae bacterium]|nr:tRNA glutamyl-Q(34) synthetase GluQRS [Methylophilaceae bacterium]